MKMESLGKKGGPEGDARRLQKLPSNFQNPPEKAKAQPDWPDATRVVQTRRFPRAT